MTTNYEETLDTCLQADQRIATYKWLSRELEVSMDEAKRMLYTYVKNQRANQKSLHVTYCLGGWTNGEMGSEHKVMLVQENQLEAAQAALAPMTFIHVYSIQPSLVKDIPGVLYAVDYDHQMTQSEQSNKGSAVSCDDVPRRIKKERSADITQTANKVSVSKTPLASVTKKEQVQKKEPFVPKDAKAASFFGKRKEPLVTADVPISTEKATAVAETNGKTKLKQKGIGGFFGGSNAKPANGSKPKEIKKGNVKQTPSTTVKKGNEENRLELPGANDEEDEVVVVHHKRLSRRVVVDSDSESDLDVPDKQPTPKKIKVEQDNQHIVINHSSPESTKESPKTTGEKVSQGKEEIEMQEQPIESQNADSALGEETSAQSEVNDDVNVTEVEVEGNKGEVERASPMDDDDDDDYMLDDFDTDELMASVEKAEAAERKKKPVPITKPIVSKPPPGKLTVHKTGFNEKTGYFETTAVLEDDPNYVAPPIVLQREVKVIPKPPPKRKITGKGPKQANITSFFAKR